MKDVLGTIVKGIRSTVSRRQKLPVGAAEWAAASAIVIGLSITVVASLALLITQISDIMGASRPETMLPGPMLLFLLTLILGLYLVTRRLSLKGRPFRMALIDPGPERVEDDLVYYFATVAASLSVIGGVTILWPANGVSGAPLAVASVLLITMSTFFTWKTLGKTMAAAALIFAVWLVVSPAADIASQAVVALAVTLGLLYLWGQRGESELVASQIKKIQSQLEPLEARIVNQVRALRRFNLKPVSNKWIRRTAIIEEEMEAPNHIGASRWIMASGIAVASGTMVTLFMGESLVVIELLLPGVAGVTDAYPFIGALAGVGVAVWLLVTLDHYADPAHLRNELREARIRVRTLKAKIRLHQRMLDRARERGGKRYHRVSAFRRSENLYQVLHTSPDSSTDSLKRAYRKLAREYHPDLAGARGETRMKQVNTAYDILSDPTRRADYDLERALDSDESEK